MTTRNESFRRSRGLLAPEGAGRYYRLNRTSLVERAADTLAAIAVSTGVEVDGLAHPHLAPLTREEKDLARSKAREAVRNARESAMSKIGAR